jgi:hypothetical protein
MQSRDFCFWLQGFFELDENAGPITASQAALISRHLDLVTAHEAAPLLLERPAKAPEPLSAPAPVRHPRQPVREQPSEPAEPHPPQVPVEPPRC